MIGATFCSGIGAPECAAPWIDWRLASDIEAFPRAFFAHRFGAVDARSSSARGAHHVLWGDLASIRPRHYRRFGLPCPEVVVAGTPCQAFSIAGLRRGLSDPRGRVTMEFLRHVHSLRRWSRSADSHVGGRGFRWLVWENVPDVLSDRDNAFGCFVGGLVGSDEPLRPPSGGSWPRAGMVAGGLGKVAWRVLDAQHFGVAQRRRRVWLVGGFGDGTDPAAILFERKGGGGDAAPGGSEGEEPVAAVPRRAPGGGVVTPNGEDLSVALLTRTGGACPQNETLVGVVTPNGENLARALLAHSHHSDAESETFLAFSYKDDGRDLPAGISPTLRSLGAYDANSGDHIAVIPPDSWLSFNARQDPIALDDLSLPLDTDSGSVGVVPPSNGWVECVTGDVTHTLTANGHDASEDGTGRGSPVVAPSASPIRRLLPVEKERLQGFPDGWTAIPFRGRPVAADGVRGKALGNSQAVPNVRWILERIGRFDGAFGGPSDGAV